MVNQYLKFISLGIVMMVVGYFLALIWWNIEIDVLIKFPFVGISVLFLLAGVIMALIVPLALLSEEKRISERK